MRKLRRLRWLLLALVLVPALITLMGCEVPELDEEAVDEGTPPAESAP